MRGTACTVRPRRLLGDVGQGLVPNFERRIRHRRAVVDLVLLRPLRSPRLLLHTLEFFQQLAPLDAALFSRFEPVWAIESRRGCLRRAAELSFGALLADVGRNVRSRGDVEIPDCADAVQAILERGESR